MKPRRLDPSVFGTNEAPQGRNHMRAIHALCAVVVAGAALLGGDPVAQAQATAATTAATAAAPKRGTFMRIQGMNGAASDSQHAGWIELSSFQWSVGRGITSANGAAGDRAGRPSVSEITVTK